MIVSSGLKISQTGTANPRWLRQPITWPIFPENSMKMKEIGQEGSIYHASV